MRNNILAAVLSVQSVYLSSPLAASSVSATPVVSFINDWSRMTRHIIEGATGYVAVGKGISLGPVSSFIGYNTLEGLRLGTGLQTTTDFSRHLLLAGQVGYGFVDRRWKYSASAGWTFNEAKGYFGSYPVNFIRAQYSFDTDPLGDDALSLSDRQSLLHLSLRRNEMILYRRSGKLDYVIEPSMQTKLEVSGSKERLYPTRYIHLDGIRCLDAWRTSISFTWNPANYFYQDRHRRISVTPYTFKIKSRIQWVKGSEADKTNLMMAELTVGKTTPLADSPITISAVAHSAVTAGHGAFPFLPALPVTPYIIRPFGSFALLRPLELPADRFADLHFRIDDGGIITGKIPGLDLLKISVTASASLAVGSLSSGNDPRKNTGMISFPYYPVQMLSWSHPYSEIGIGLDHILGFGRIEYVRRLSYLSGERIRKNGVSIGLDLTY